MYSTASDNNPPDNLSGGFILPVENSSQKKFSKFQIASLFVITFLVIGVIAGIILVQQEQNIQEKASGCGTWCAGPDQCTGPNQIYGSLCPNVGYSSCSPGTFPCGSKSSGSDPGPQPTQNPSTGGSAPSGGDGPYRTYEECSAATGGICYFCDGCLDGYMRGTKTCNEWLDLKCNQPGCAGDGAFPAPGESCCAGLVQCDNGRCAPSCIDYDKKDGSSISKDDEQDIRNDSREDGSRDTVSGSDSTKTFSPFGACDNTGEVHTHPTCIQGYKVWVCGNKKWLPDYGNPANAVCSSQCPWPVGEGEKCCPKGPDACTNIGSYICIDDPFIAKCEPWAGCATGYYKAFEWYTLDDMSSYEEAKARYCGGQETPEVPPIVIEQISTPAPSSSPAPSSTPSPGPSTPTLSAICFEVKFYDSNWNRLLVEDLKKLKAGDNIYIAVRGTTSGGEFDMARFTINGEVQPITTLRRPETNEFYMQYTIPAGIRQFRVRGELHHTDSRIGWI